MGIKRNTNPNEPLFTLYLDDKTRIHIQNGNEKLGQGIHHISLLPFNDYIRFKGTNQPLCNIIGTCGKHCTDCKNNCYAANYIRRRANSCIPAYGENTLLAREDPNRYFDEIERYLRLNLVPVFRWHIAGEIISVEYLDEMVSLAFDFPETQFYCYTKAYELIEARERVTPSNLHFLVSIWHKNYANPLHFPEFIYDDGTEPELEHLFHCPATDKNGHETGVTCARCRKCWHVQSGDKIAVYGH